MSGSQAAALAVAYPSRCMRTPQTTRRYFTALRRVDKRTDGHVLLHIPQAILRRVVGHVPARAVLLGGVRRDDVWEGLQVDAFMPNPAQECDKQHQ